MLNSRVSVVIATYNRYKDLQECLNSIFDLKTRPHEVIVVDSDSADETKRLADSFPIKFACIKERNRQRARNIGIHMAEGDIVAFLDDDVVVSERWLEHIVSPYARSGVGGVGGRVVPYGKSGNFHVRTRKEDVGKVFKTGLVIGNFDLPLDNWVRVDSFIGCNMSFRKDLLLTVGGFDENYEGTGYRDDTDLCMRVRKMGYELIYNPKALVSHKFKGKKVGSEWSYWYVRNHVYFYLKNIYADSRTGFPMFLYHMFFPPRDYLLKSGVKLRRESTLVLNVLEGLLDGFRTWHDSLQVK